MKEPEPLKFIPFPDQETPGFWRVEAVDSITNDAYVAVFTGLDAEFRAREYAKFKNGKVPASKPETKTISPAPNRITLAIQDGQEITFNLEDVSWTWNSNRKTITGKQKLLIELKGKS